MRRSEGQREARSVKRRGARREGAARAARGALEKKRPPAFTPQKTMVSYHATVGESRKSRGRISLHAPTKKIKERWLCLGVIAIAELGEGSYGAYPVLVTGAGTQ